MSRCVARWVALAAWLTSFLAAAIWSVRAAVADGWARMDTEAGLLNAIEWCPGRADYQLQLAFLLVEKDPARSEAALRRAVALNPNETRAWIALGLRHEARNEFAAAERCLIHAAERDKQYAPRWSLANYYYRRKDLNQFWRWAVSAAQVVAGDPKPLFRLCVRLAPAENLVERLAIKNAQVRAQYLLYLFEENQAGQVVPVAARVLESNRAVDLQLVQSACGWLLEKGRAEDALTVWNRLAARGAVPFEELDPARGRSLTNGDFAVAPNSRGFDWRLTGTAGISASMEESPPGLRLTLSRSQPENCEVLVQYLAVLERTNYEIRFVYRTSGIPSKGGLQWRVTDLRGGNNLLQRMAGDGTTAGAEIASAENETQGEFAFATPAGCRFARLALIYERVRGSTRIAGDVILRRVELVRKN